MRKNRTRFKVGAFCCLSYYLLPVYNIVVWHIMKISQKVFIEVKIERDLSLTLPGWKSSFCMTKRNIIHDINEVSIPGKMCFFVVVPENTPNAMCNKKCNRMETPYHECSKVFELDGNEKQRYLKPSFYLICNKKLFTPVRVYSRKRA
jgi:hypothetical protein